MSYSFRKATKKDEPEVKKLYEDHASEVEPLGLYFHINQFFEGRTDDTVEIWVCVYNNIEIIAAFRIHYAGEECHVNCGLVHKNHRRIGPAKMARKLYRDLAIKGGCKYLIRRHPDNALHIKHEKLETAGWEIKSKGGMTTIIGDLTKIDVGNEY